MVRRPAAQLREPVRGGWTRLRSGQPLHGAREADDKARYLPHLFEDNHADAMAVLGAMSAEAEGRECGGDPGAAMNAGEVSRFCCVRRNRKVPGYPLLVGYASPPEHQPRNRARKRFAISPG